MFNTSGVYDIGEPLAVRMILDGTIRRAYNAQQLNHAMRCLFLYLFYAKVREVHGGVPMPMDRLTPPGTLSHKVTKANTGLVEVRGCK